MTLFTSSGTKGFQLDSEKYSIPDTNNASGVINSKHSKLELAQKFYDIGWSVRKSAFDNYEIEGEWAEFEVVGEGEVLISCSIDVSCFDQFVEILTKFDIGFSLELYNEEMKLIRVVTNV